MPPSLESSLALNERPRFNQKLLVLDVPIIKRSPVRSTGKPKELRFYGDEPLSVKPSDVAPRNGRIVGRVAELGQIPVYTLKVGDVEINDIKLWEILDYVSPLELERYENEQFKEEAEALDAARAAAEVEKEEKRIKQAEKARLKGVVLDVNSDESESTGGGNAQGERGRARPTYTHLFKQPAERRRRRKRDPITNELLPLSDDDISDGIALNAPEEPRRRRRRKRDPVTNELMPLSDREDCGESEDVLVVTSKEPQKRRRRKRDPITNELMPLSDRDVDVTMGSSDDQAASTSRSPAPAASDIHKRRRRKRDPVTGVLLPLDPIKQEGKSSEAGSDYKRPRRRRHPITRELMPLGWTYKPEEGKKTPAKPKDLMSPAMGKMSISQEHGFKRIKLASESSDDLSQNRPTPATSSQMPIRMTPVKKGSRAFDPDVSGSDSFSEAAFTQRPGSATKPPSMTKTSIMHPTGTTVDAEFSSDSSSGESITLASFLKSSRHDNDPHQELDIPKRDVQAEKSQAKAVMKNPTASQQRVGSSEEEDNQELDEDEWVVEGIVGHRMSDPKSHPGRKQVLLYHTKWADSDELTWEPFDSFVDPAMVYAYRLRVGLDKRGGDVSRQPAQSSQKSIARGTSSKPAPIPKQSEPLSDSESEDEDKGEQDWEVEAILGHHMSDPRTHPGKPRTMLYKVKWVGWKEHTWEPVASFPDKAVVNAYRRKVGMLPL